MAGDGKQRGRPRVWASQQERQRAHRVQQAAKAREVAALLDAVRNARLDDAGLIAAVAAEDDVVLLAALTGYYRARHWMRRRPTAEAAEPV